MARQKSTPLKKSKYPRKYPPQRVASRLPPWTVKDQKYFVFSGLYEWDGLCRTIGNTIMAESEGFEPPVAFRLRLISSQVHSTGLCQLSTVLSATYNLT